MKYKVNKGFIIQKVGDKPTIFDGEKSVLYTFNKTAFVVFEKIKLGWDEEKIIQYFVKIYSVNKKIAEKDIEEIIKNFLKEGIIKKN